MDKLDKAGCRQEAPGGSHQVCEDGRPLQAWKIPAGRTQAQQGANSADGLRLDTLGTVSVSDLSSSIGCLGGTTQSTFHKFEAGEQHQDKPDHGGLDEILQDEGRSGQGDHDQILEEEEGNENSVREIPMEDTVRTVCEQAAKNISEILDAELRGCLQAAMREKVLGAELRGGLQAALREEVSRTVREEFQRCSQELREFQPQRILVENGCQADGTTVPAQLRSGHSKSDGNLPWPTGASFPQSQTSSEHCILDPCTHTVATANCGQKLSLPWPGNEASDQKLMLPKHGDEARHHTGCGDSVVSGVSSRALPAAHHQAGCGDSLAPGISSGAQPAAHCLSYGDSFTHCGSNSGQSIVDEEQSVISVRQSNRLRAVQQLFEDQGLTKYVSDLTSPRRSRSSPETQTEPMPWQNSGSRTRKLPPQEVCSTACLLGADPRDSRCSPEKMHKCLQDAGSQHRRGPRYTSTPTDEEGWHSSETKQDLCSSFSSKWDQRSTTPEVRRFCTSETSMNSSEEIVRREKSFDTAHSSIEGSLAQSTSHHRSWIKTNAGLRVPTVEMLMKNRDDELVSHLSLDDDKGDLDSVAPTHLDRVAPAPPGHESARRSWFVALARNISSQFGRLVAPTCAIIPWATAYPWASAFYRWVILCLVSKAVYHSASMTYEVWEMSESMRATVLATDTVMGMGALFCILACGALCGSKVLIQCCKLLMAYSYKTGVSAYWEEVSTTDSFCTASFWFASVLAMTLESIHFEHCTTAQDLLSHVGCFALFAFILMGMSQFSIHICRCLMTMIDLFCCQAIEQSDFSEALREWSLLQAVCRTACSSIQFAFLSLQVTATALVLLSIQQVGRHDASRLLSLAPGFIIAMGVFRASLWAAAVTNKCTRVPMLVNSMSVGTLLEKDRMYTVHYIAYSQAGFYIFDLRVTSAAVMKTVYLACAITFFLATRVFGE